MLHYRTLVEIFLLPHFDKYVTSRSLDSDVTIAHLCRIVTLSHIVKDGKDNSLPHFCNVSIKYLGKKVTT